MERVRRKCFIVNEHNLNQILKLEPVRFAGDIDYQLVADNLETRGKQIVSLTIAVDRNEVHSNHPERSCKTLW